MEPEKIVLPTLGNIAKGAAEERFQHEWSRVLENIADPNTDPEASRTITLTFTVKPDAKRETMSVSVQGKAKLAALARAETFMSLGRIKGALVATEPGLAQRGLFDEEQPAPAPAPVTTPAANPAAVARPDFKAVEGGKA